MGLILTCDKITLIIVDNDQLGLVLPFTSLHKTKCTDACMSSKTVSQGENTDRFLFLDG